MSLTLFGEGLTQTLPKSWAEDKAYISETINPGEDFYRFANEKWLLNAQLPEGIDLSNFKSIEELEKAIDGEPCLKELERMLEGLIKEKKPQTFYEQQLLAFYESYMDIERLETLGLEPLRPQINKILGAETQEQLEAIAFQLIALSESIPNTKESVYESIFSDDNETALASDFLGLHLPTYYDSEYDFGKEKEIYLNSIRAIFTILGIPNVEEKAQGILGFETEIATAANETIRISRTEFDEIKNRTPLDIQKAYLIYHCVNYHSPVLAPELAKLCIEYIYQKDLHPDESNSKTREERAVVLLTEVFREQALRFYCDRHQLDRHKEAITPYAERVRNAFCRRIETIDWLDDESRQAMLEKLNRLRPIIGYPDDGPDFSDIEFNPSKLIENFQKLAERFNQYAEERGSRLVRIDMELDGSPCYDPEDNAYILPPGAIKEFFLLSNPEDDPAFIFGSLGACVGHEIAHAFDTSGCQYDSKNKKVHCLSEGVQGEFSERTGRLVRQFNKYRTCEHTGRDEGIRQTVDGQYTLDENLCDLAGVMVAYDAYKAYIQEYYNGEEAPVIDGYTGDQRFFITYAMFFRCPNSEALIKFLLEKDEHAIPEWRVNGILRNIDAWYDAFGITENAPLYLAPEERVRIW